jgi:hypothetical protein
MFSTYVIANLGATERGYQISGFIPLVFHASFISPSLPFVG